MGSSRIDPESVTTVIYTAIDHVNGGLDDGEKVAKSPDAELFGGNGALDSLSLVNLIVVVEQGVAGHFGRSITIANEKAFSERNSPFRTVGSLTEFVTELLEEDSDG